MRKIFASEPVPIEKQIKQTKRHFLWWFDYPTDFTRPVHTLYLMGWCIAQNGQPIREIRSRVGRRIFPGNYGSERKDVVAVHALAQGRERTGFAIAVPLPAGKSEVITEVKDARGDWQPIDSREVLGAPDEKPEPPQDPKYFIPNSGANPRIDFWLDRPAVWSRKVRHLRLSGWCLATTGPEITAVRARLRGKEFSARFGLVRPDIAVLFGNKPGSLGSGFTVDVLVPPGRAGLILEARSGEGPWETFFTHPLRGPLWREQLDEGEEAVGDYAFWIRRYDHLRAEDRRLIRGQIATFKNPPLISVLLPVYNSNGKWLRRAIASVQAQLYPHWELCMIDDASTDRQIWPLLQKFACRDVRIKVRRRAENGHIAAASNDALALARGEFVALLDHDDELAPTALYFVALALQENPALQLLYSDEDKLDRRNRRCDPYFKSDWNPQLFLGQNFISHLGVFRTALVRQVGGFRVGFEGSQDYDLTLRCLEKIDPWQIRHIPRILYHWRATEESTAASASAKPYAREAARRAVQEHLDRSGIAGTVVPHHGIYQRIQYALPTPRPLVSILIPTRDRTVLLRKCIESLFAKTDYENFELIVLDNESGEAEAREYLESLGQDGRVRVERVAGAFNYSRLNNRGVELARGSFVAFLNNDIEVKSPLWLHEMMSLAIQPGVGMVGARLWYPGGTMQHGGVILGVGGIAGHAHLGVREEQDGYFSRAHLTQNFSAVTAACAVVRRDLYRELGGLDEAHLAVAFNDIDFCLRLRAAGFEIVWTPHAELFHHESASRGMEDTGEKQARFLAEVDYMNAKWGETLRADPFYNPNLSLDEELFTPAFPPRLAKPWKS
ncbi:MAG: glycosyltransferase family 2 protein [Chthoniobacterales bacterium]